MTDNEEKLKHTKKRKPKKICAKTGELHAFQRNGGCKTIGSPVAIAWYELKCKDCGALSSEQIKV